VFLGTGFGFYQLGITNRAKRLARKEKREGRMAIIPFLQVEQDRKLSIALKSTREAENEIMKSNPDWKGAEDRFSKRWKVPQIFR